MRYRYLLLLVVTLASCNWFKQKAKNSAHRAGEVAAKAGSEFADGVAEGVQRTFENQVLLSADLKKAGVEVGKVLISSTDSTTDNVLNVYMVFNKPVDQPIVVKVFDEKDREYGRSSMVVKGKAGEAGYVDVVFDRRTNIDGKGKLVFE